MGLDKVIKGGMREGVVERVLLDMWNRLLPRCVWSLETLEKGKPSPDFFFRLPRGRDVEQAQVVVWCLGDRHYCSR